MRERLRLALFQPDMPANTGAVMRLCACLSVPLDIIEPCGFVLDDKRLRRAAMDYIRHLTYERHQSWDEYLASVGRRRIILLTTKAEQSYLEYSYHESDILLLGQESAGVPDFVHARADARIKIMMKNELRSLNVGMAAAIVLSEALRQTKDQSERPQLKIANS